MKVLFAFVYLNVFNTSEPCLPAGTPEYVLFKEPPYYSKTF
jgi:hypothetical protein